MIYNLKPSLNIILSFLCYVIFDASRHSLHIFFLRSPQFPTSSKQTLNAHDSEQFYSVWRIVRKMLKFQLYPTHYHEVSKKL